MCISDIFKILLLKIICAKIAKHIQFLPNIVNYGMF